MRIAIEEKYVLNSIEELTWKTYDELNNYDYFIILSEFKAYQFFKRSVDGTFQASGTTGLTGWWKDNSAYLIDKELKPVPNDFEFSASTCIEVYSVGYYYFMYSRGKIDIEGFRDALQIFADTENYTGMTSSDRRTLVRHNIFPSGSTKQERDDYVAEFFTPEEHRKLKLKIWSEVPQHREERFDKIKIKFGEFEEDDLITKQDIVTLWRDVRHLIEDWINTPNKDIYDWIKTEGIHASDGFATKPYYNETIRDEVVKIMVDGIFEDLEFTDS